MSAGGRTSPANGTQPVLLSIRARAGAAWSRLDAAPYFFQLRGTSRQAGIPHGDPLRPVVGKIMYLISFPSFLLYIDFKIDGFIFFFLSIIMAKAGNFIEKQCRYNGTDF
jgi:hypothetical protein